MQYISRCFARGGISFAAKLCWPGGIFVRIKYAHRRPRDALRSSRCARLSEQKRSARSPGEQLIPSAVSLWGYTLAALANETRRGERQKLSFDFLRRGASRRSFASAVGRRWAVRRKRENQRKDSAAACLTAHRPRPLSARQPPAYSTCIPRDSLLSNGRTLVRRSMFCWTYYAHADMRNSAEKVYAVLIFLFLFMNEFWQLFWIIWILIFQNPESRIWITEFLR